MSTTARTLIAIAGLSATAIAAAETAHFASPQQPWSSPDGNVHLLRPIAAAPGTSDAALGSLMTPGWRLVWDGSTDRPGRMVVRLALKVNPPAPQTGATQVLQVGVSRDPLAVRTCLVAGLKGGSAQHRPDRTINGHRFAVWTNGDAGMSQSISATDLRTVVNGACYAVERFSDAMSAGDRDPAITLPQARGAQQLDAALASIQLGPLAAGQVLRPSVIPGNGHAVAR